jgi:hypothetical protein
MTFPLTGVLDDFNRANEGPPPSASWAGPLYADDGSMKVVGNEAVGTEAAEFNGAYWLTPMPPSCEVHVKVATMPADGERTSVYLRVADEGGAPDGYLLSFYRWDGGSDGWQIYRVDNGAWTQLGATVDKDVSAGDSMGLEAIGPRLRGYQKTGGVWAEVEVLERTDSTYSNWGKIAMSPQNDTCTLDDFGGGGIQTPALRRRQEGY